MFSEGKATVTCRLTHSLPVGWLVLFELNSGVILRLFFFSCTRREEYSIILCPRRGHFMFTEYQITEQYARIDPQTFPQCE